MEYKEDLLLLLYLTGLLASAHIMDVKSKLQHRRNSATLETMLIFSSWAGVCIQLMALALRPQPFVMPTHEDLP